MKQTAGRITAAGMIREVSFARLSIIDEMRAALEGRRGRMLRKSRGSTHRSAGDGERAPPADEQSLPAAVAWGRRLTQGAFTGWPKTTRQASVP